MIDSHVVVDGDNVYVQCSRDQWLHIMALIGSCTHNNCTIPLYMCCTKDVQSEAAALARTMSAQLLGIREQSYTLTFSGDVT
jgi:hypothetical protein